MAKAKAVRVTRSNDEIRRIMLQYFYDRNRNATSSRGKKGSAVKISDVKKELKASHDLTQQDVQSNLTYLISQRWVEEDSVEKTFTAPGGTVIPSTTTYYKITAQGMDKIDGPSEFTPPKFSGINIQATGQAVITLGDGNVVNAQFGELGKGLSELREAITKSDAPEAEKMSLVADIDTIQSQLSKPEPNRGIIKSAWEAVKGAAAINGCAAFFARVAGLIGGFL